MEIKILSYVYGSGLQVEKNWDSYGCQQIVLRCFQRRGLLLKSKLKFWFLWENEKYYAWTKITLPTYLYLSYITINILYFWEMHVSELRNCADYAHICFQCCTFSIKWFWIHDIIWYWQDFSFPIDPTLPHTDNSFNWILLLSKCVS